MRAAAACAGAIVLLTACAPGSSARTPHRQASAQAKQTGAGVPSRLAVLVSDPSAPGDRYSVELVAADGRVVASAQPRKPSPGPSSPMPLVSASDSRAYFLDGDTDIRFLAPDGTSGLATHVAGTSQVRAGFSVSPDDQRIAVSLLDYSQDPVLLRMYVEDMQFGNHHVEIFGERNSQSSEWPVGWRDGALVVAIGVPNVQSIDVHSVEAANPYAAGNAGPPDAYHLVDPATGNRLAAYEQSCDQGPLVPAGLECAFGKITIRAWDGTLRDFSSQVTVGPLSPDGTRIAYQTGGSAQFAITDGSTATVGHGAGIPEGWIDATHLVVARPGGGSLDGNAVVDVAHGTAAVVPDSKPARSFFGTIPGGLGVADSFACRLPVGGLATDWSNPALRHVGFLQLPGDHFQADDQDAITWDRTAGTMHTVQAPILTGADAESYDAAAHRWVPSDPSLVSPDGSHYAYLAADLSLHVVDVRTPTDRSLLPANDLYLMAYSAQGIYADRGVQMGPMPTGHTLWLVDPSTGGLTQVASTLKQWEYVGLGTAWATEVNPADPHPWVQSPLEPAQSVANDELVGLDLATRSLQSWFYRPGARVEIAGHTPDGKLMVVVTNPAVTEIWLLAAPNTGVKVYAGPGAGGRDRFGINTAGLGSIGITDSHGIWIGTEQSVLLYTTEGGLEKVWDKQGRPAGPCL